MYAILPHLPVSTQSSALSRHATFCIRSSSVGHGRSSSCSPCSNPATSGQRFRVTLEPSAVQDVRMQMHDDGVPQAWLGGELKRSNASCELAAVTTILHCTTRTRRTAHVPLLLERGGSPATPHYEQ